MSCMPGVGKKRRQVHTVDWITKCFLVTVFFCCFGLATAEGQAVSIGGKSIVALQQEKEAAIVLSDFSTPKMTTTPVAKTYPSLSAVFQTSTTPKIYAFEELAFFCKIEVELEKAAKIPVKFRLGSVPYVDRLEGKIDY